MENKFYELFNDQKYKEAKKCLQIFKKHAQFETDLDSRSEYFYCKACLLYKEHSYNKAQKLLNELLELQDKTNLTERNIAIRIVNIIVLVELNKINEVYDALECFRKYIERNCKTFQLSKRDELILKLLKELEKSGFEYYKENKSIEAIIDKLAAVDTEFSWKKSSCELIPFHAWVESRIRNR